MLRILVFNGTPQAAESRLVEAGSRTYDTLIREAFDRHLADRAKIDYFTLRVADGKRLPQGLGIVDFDGVWISGSPFNAYRPDQPSVQAQIDLVREIWEKGVPAFGSCWGLQLMTVALGGTVHLNSERPGGRRSAAHLSDQRGTRPRHAPRQGADVRSALRARGRGRRTALLWHGVGVQ
jgi:GMP synthase (glutamine-hydrolysing)